jgi:hypothetical protein
MTPHTRSSDRRPLPFNRGGQPSGRPPGRTLPPEAQHHGSREVGGDATQDSYDPLLALRPHHDDNARRIVIPVENIAAIVASTLPTHSTLPDPRTRQPTTRSPADVELVRIRTAARPPFEPEWTLNPLIWAQLLSMHPSTLAHPPVEWFASIDAHVSRRFKHAADSAWGYRWDAKHWGILLCPADNEFTRAVIDKCFQDGSTATIITHFSPHERWFTKLSTHSYLLADLPHKADARLRIHDGEAAGEAIKMRAFFIDCRAATVDSPTRMQLTLPDGWRSLYRPIRSGLALNLWQQLLQHHPDDAFVTRFLDTARHGAITGYHGPRLSPRACKNPRSDHTVELRRLRDVEAQKGWRSGPFRAEDPPLVNLMCNPTKGVTKRGSTKVRHCVNHSAPYDDTSVNALTERIRAIEHTKFEEVAALVDHMGPHALLIKVDIVAAYKQIWLALQELHLHGEMENFDGDTLVAFSNVLNFGGTTSADIFEDLGEALEFVLRLLVFPPPHGIARYADDFIAAIAPCDGMPDYTTALRLRKELDDTGALLGTPLAKWEGPCPRLAFLGTGVDAPLGIAFITEQRKAWALEDLLLWRHAKSGSQRELLSLAGTLDNLARVITWGKAFIARIRRAAYSVRQLHLRVRLDNLFRLDIQWWMDTLPITNSRPLRIREWSPHDSPVMDASPTGFGAYFNGAWLYGVWPQETLQAAFRESTVSTGFLELLIIAITAATWGRLWTGHRVLVWTDNTSAEAAINNRCTPDKHMQPIIRAIGLLASQHGFDVRADHIDTKLNTIADPLSRSQTNPDWFALFTQAAPNAQSTPTTPLLVPGLSFRHV